MLGIAAELDCRPPLAWWPEDAVFAADFAGWRFMCDGTPIAATQAFALLRMGPAWDDAVQELAANTPRRSAAGLLLEEARQRLSDHPATPTDWTFLSGMPIVTPLPGEPPFSPIRIASDGNIFARVNLGPQSLASGERISLRVRYRAGTSERLGVYMRDEVSGVQSILDGPAGAIAAQSASGGAWSNIVNTVLGGGLHEVTATIAVNTSSAGWRMGLSPRSTVVGADVEVFGAMNEKRDRAGNWLLGQTNQPAEQLVLHLPEDDRVLEVQLDDGSTQSIEGVGPDHVLTAEGLGFAGRRFVIGGIVAW